MQTKTWISALTHAHRTAGIGVRLRGAVTAHELERAIDRVLGDDGIATRSAELRAVATAPDVHGRAVAVLEALVDAQS